ncbi:MAG: ABC transporter substrate-binding protein [Flavobacteriaceae bacterium]|nr:ABC transporter substrate-binding protein [Flavobacteriaceae bacterium]
MQKQLFLLFISLSFFGCKEIQESPSIVQPTENSINIDYAKGFQIDTKNGFKVLTVSNPWPGSDKQYKYALVTDSTLAETIDGYDAVVKVPLSNIVVTSTTHIPSLEMLEVDDKLVGFPNLNYVSSEKIRQRIDASEIRELGKNEDINTEVLIEMSPELVVTFAVEGGNKTVSTIQKTDIPVMYNSDWTEVHPLGKAEWIKFFGVLFGKEVKADSIFNQIEKDYNNAKELAAAASKSPTVLSGAMYKDIWYLPQGDSWAAKFIEDANGDYLWKESEGVGSLSLNLESVLEKGENAEYWIGPGQFISLNQLAEAHDVYEQFKAYETGEVYTFTANKGATGGVIYYELAPNRPDLVLKDMVKILHPELLPDYELYFFRKLE